MIQNALKVLTLGFFISMISGFVAYRMGYFDSDRNTHSLQSSPNGGELLNANSDQDTNRTPQINQNNAQPIMPSSKSISPAFDLKKHQKERMSSSKSMTHPIEFKLEEEDVKEHYTQTAKPTKPAPTIDLKKYEAEKAEEEYRLSSSKSVIITDFQPMFKKWFSVNGPEGIKVQPELIPKDSSKIEKEDERNIQIDPNLVSNRLENEPEPKVEVEKSRGIAWGTIGLGVLGILFVAIGSIVYFKRKSN